MNKKFIRILAYLWILVVFIPFFNGLGFIIAGYTVNHKRWVDEGIIYMIPFIFMSFGILNDYIIYLFFILWVVEIIRMIMILNPYRDRLNVLLDNLNVEKHVVSRGILRINIFTYDELISWGLSEDISKQIINLRSHNEYITSKYDLYQKLNLNNNQIQEVESYIDYTYSINKRKLDL